MRGIKKSGEAAKAYAKIDEEISWYSKKISKGYDRPRKRFIKDMLSGIIKSGKCLLSQISVFVKKEEKAFHSVEKRLSREMSNQHWEDGKLEENHYKLIDDEYIDADTTIALDLTDVNKENGRVFENLTKVHDGSSGRIVKGYWAVVIEAIKGKNNHIPLYMELYSDKAKGFISQFNQIKTAVEEVVRHFGTNGLWTMDRGFDSLRQFLFFNKMGLKFLIRGFIDRMVERGDGIRMNIQELIKHAELRGTDTYFQFYTINPYARKKKWTKKTIRIRYDFMRLKIYSSKEDDWAERKFIELFIIITEGLARKGERSFFFTNITITDLNDCFRLLKKYSKRWPCEESIRFVKQSFQIENVRVQSYLALRRMMKFVMLSYEFVCLLIRRLLQKNKKVFFYLKSLTIERNLLINFYHYKIIEALRKLVQWDFVVQIELR